MSSENPTWADIKKWAEADIEKSRSLLEAADSEAVRARIAVMRDLLALKSLPPVPVIPGPVSY
jgi:hypothetical protein